MLYLVIRHVSLEKFKYKILFNFFKNKKKLLWTLTQNLISNSINSPKISVLNLSENTIFGKKDEKIFVTNDSYQTWYIMNDKNFHNNFVKKISEVINHSKRYNFIDIGANTGLITRSILNNLSNIENSFLVEPDQDNLFCLKKNLDNFKNINISEFALDITDGKKKLFIDKNNKGNLSFNFEMMKLKENKLSFMNSEDNYKIVNCRSTVNYFNEIKNNLKNVIKIDVQGYDENIFQEIPEQVLYNTDILIMEITPLKTKTFDKKKFFSKLSCFKKIINFNNEKISTDQLSLLIDKKSGQSYDLIFLNN